MNDNTKTILALVTGIAAGAALGLLFAPGKGDDTRKQLTDAADDIADMVKRKIDVGVGVMNSFKNKIYENSTADSSFETAADNQFKSGIQKDF